MADFDQVCAICGARYGDHNAPIPYCPDGDGFRRDAQFKPSPAMRSRGRTQLDQLRDADMARLHGASGIMALWRAEIAPRPEDGAEHVAGFSLANRSEVERAARKWRQGG